MSCQQEPEDRIDETFSKKKLGLKPNDLPLKAAAPLGIKGNVIHFIATVPNADSKGVNEGAVIIFDKSGQIINRINGEIQGEQLGLDMDVRGNEAVVVSNQRLIRIKDNKVIFEMSLSYNLFAHRGLQVAFTEDIDKDNKADILLGAPYANVGKLLEAGQIQVIGSKSGEIIDVIYGVTKGQHLGNVLQSINLDAPNRLK